MEARQNQEVDLERSSSSEIIGTLFLTLGILIFLSLLSFHRQLIGAHDPSPSGNLIGHIGHYSSYVLFYLLGKSAFFMGPYIFIIGALALFRGSFKDALPRNLSIIILMLSTAIFASLYDGSPAKVSDLAGGLLGASIADFLQTGFGHHGAMIITIAFYVVGIFLAIRLPAPLLFSKIHSFMQSIAASFRYTNIFGAVSSLKNSAKEEQSINNQNMSAPISRAPFYRKEEDFEKPWIGDFKAKDQEEEKQEETEVFELAEPYYPNETRESTEELDDVEASVEKTAEFEKLHTLEEQIKTINGILVNLTRKKKSEKKGDLEIEENSSYFDGYFNKDESRFHFRRQLFSSLSSQTPSPSQVQETISSSPSISTNSSSLDKETPQDCADEKNTSKDHSSYEGSEVSGLNKQIPDDNFSDNSFGESGHVSNDVSSTFSESSIRNHYKNFDDHHDHGENKKNDKDDASKNENIKNTSVPSTPELLVEREKLNAQEALDDFFEGKAPKGNDKVRAFSDFSPFSKKDISERLNSPFDPLDRVKDNFEVPAAGLSELEEAEELNSPSAGAKENFEFSAAGLSESEEAEEAEELNSPSTEIKDSFEIPTAHLLEAEKTAEEKKGSSSSDGSARELSKKEEQNVQNEKLLSSLLMEKMSKNTKARDIYQNEKEDVETQKQEKSRLSSALREDKKEELKNSDEIIPDSRATMISPIEYPTEYKLPYDILDTAELIPETHLSKEIQIMSKKIDQALSDYSISGRVVFMQRGPIISLYEIQLDPGVKVSRILGLENELKMHLEIPSIRIIAPIPGKSTIGIELPNRNRENVYLSQLIKELPKREGALSILLGKDITGKNHYVNLTTLPHLLIAGATGTGKSVYINSIIASLLYNYNPNELRMIMVDPKMVELGLYEGIPHLLLPVITDTSKVTRSLAWVLDEMEHRYTSFSKVKCRDIYSYNLNVKQKSDKIPYIILIIDELSDLMMVSPKEVEDSIIRLTQKARAVGIHLIMATQRPSVDVITALIKANCPARIAFQVAQKTDSRTILDINGAEALLGKGDMLYRSPEMTSLKRLQAPLITEKEIAGIVRETRRHSRAKHVDLDLWEQSQQKYQNSAEEVDQELFNEAWEIIQETGKTSSSYLQRRLRIGYNRAANIIEELERRGYLSKLLGSKGREILKTR